MITFATQAAFEDAVIAAIANRVAVGVTVSKERKCYYEADEYTKVKVTLFDKPTGDDIDSSEDYA